MLEGDSARQIRQQLREQELIPVAVEPVEQKQSLAKNTWLQKN